MNAKFVKALRRLVKRMESLEPETSYEVKNSKNRSMMHFGVITLNPKCRRGAYQTAKKVAKKNAKYNRAFKSNFKSSTASAA